MEPVLTESKGSLRSKRFAEHVGSSLDRTYYGHWLLFVCFSFIFIYIFVFGYVC